MRIMLVRGIENHDGKGRYPTNSKNNKEKCQQVS